MTIQVVLLIIFAYLIGSIPTAYLVVRWLKGIDLRQYGSGTISGSMVWKHVSRWEILPVSEECAKPGESPEIKTEHNAELGNM